MTGTWDEPFTVMASDIDQPCDASDCTQPSGWLVELVGWTGEQEPPDCHPVQRVCVDHVGAALPSLLEQAGGHPRPCEGSAGEEVTRPTVQGAEGRVTPGEPVGRSRSPYVQRLTGQVLRSDDAGSALVVNEEIDPLDGLIWLVSEVYGGEWPRDNPVLAEASAQVKVQVWRSCTKAWREGEDVGDDYTDWWAPHGDGARQVLVVWYPDDVYGLGERAHTATAAASLDAFHQANCLGAAPDGTPDRCRCPATAAARCECGKAAPFDGGAEGVCECCSTCTREPAVASSPKHCDDPAGRNQRDLALSEAQEAVHVARFDHRNQTPPGRTPVGGPDTFYNGVRHAEAVIRDMRGGDASGLAIEHANLRRDVDAWRKALEAVACGPVDAVWRDVSAVIDAMRDRLGTDGGGVAEYRAARGRDAFMGEPDPRDDDELAGR